MLLHSGLKIKKETILEQVLRDVKKKIQDKDERELIARVPLGKE